MDNVNKKKERNFQKKRIELFTKNSESIEKITLTSLECNFLYSKYIKSESNDLLRNLYKVFFDNLGLIFNENLALYVFPFFTEEFLFSKKIEVEAEYFNKLKFKIIDTGFQFKDYKKIGDFLKEPTGSFKDVGGKNMTHNDLKMYSDVMEKALLKTIEIVFVSSIKKQTQEMKDKEKDNLLTLSKSVSCVKKTEELIKDVASNYYSKIVDLDFSDLFLLYNLEEESLKLTMKKEDAIMFKEQDEMILDFINAFKTNKDKKLIIRSRDLHQIFITNENKIINEFEDDVEEDFRLLINKMMYDFENSSSIIVQEKTGILNPQGVEQFKICGLIINKGEFKVIDKDLIKQLYFKIIDREALDDDKSYRFFNWLYDFLPDFN
jgi:hypothetical protein